MGGARLALAKRENVDRALGRLKLRAMFQLDKNLPPATSVAEVVATFDLLLTQAQREDTFFTGRLFNQYNDAVTAVAAVRDRAVVAPVLVADPVAFFSSTLCESDWPDLQPLIIRSLLAPINSVGPELCFSMVRAMMRKDRYSMKDAAFFNEIFIKFNRDFVPEMLRAGLGLNVMGISVIVCWMWWAAA